jgi:hypothetical protein
VLWYERFYRLKRLLLVLNQARSGGGMSCSVKSSTNSSGDAQLFIASYLLCMVRGSSTLPYTGESFATFSAAFLKRKLECVLSGWHQKLALNLLAA